ncbi:Hypothetical protein I5071_2990 [Sandaracinus amylolyticus]|nr:Hypothetical protein I5071_2990 [Sandaracinus amylolyticus]
MRLMNAWNCIRPIAIALLLASCEDAGPTLIEAPLGEFPSSVEQLGIYPDPADLDTVDVRAVAYAPTHQLWTNGADKHRYVVLPEGETIDAADPERWTFPTGTLLFKTFAYPREDGTSRPVETRVMRLNEEGEWDFASYRWDGDGRGGARAELRVAETVPVDAFGESFDHAIPSQRQCRQCHEAGRRRVLGLNDRSLADDTNQIDRLVESGAIDLGARTPLVIPAHESADERAVIAYAWANCAHCHDGSVGTNAAFDLRPEVFLENTIDRETESEASAAGIRVVPGDPDTSVIVSAMLDDDGARAMPPLGVQRRDAESIALIRRWIAALPSTR